MNFTVKIYKMSAGFFQARYLDPKTGKRKRKRFKTLREAKEYKAKSEKRVTNEGITAFSTLRLSDALEHFIKKFPNSNIKERKLYFIAFIDDFGCFKVNELSTDDLRVWFEKFRVERKLSEKTLNQIRSQFFGFFEYLVEESHVALNPLKKIRFSHSAPPKRARVILSSCEIEELLSNAKVFSEDFLHPVLYTLVHTGARRSEILNLKRKDVDFKLGLIHIRKTKNGDDRYVRMGQNLSELLKTTLNSHSHEHIFSERLDQAARRFQLTSTINKFKHYFPMDKNWGCHCLRHSFAYNFLKAGGEMYQLQAVLGHRGIQMTIDLYGQLKAQDVKNPSPYNF